MSTDLSLVESSQVIMPVTTQELLNRVERIREVQLKVMKDGVDFGTVQGCGDKPTLLKPGAETLLLAFQMAAIPDQLTIQDLGNEDEVRYRIVTPIIHIPTGRVCGHGVGECSSLEEKYKWRKAVCQEEFDETDPDRRRVKWAKSREGAYQVYQVRTNKADVANTVLKMGKKRSLVDGALTVTAASRIFTQDLEEMPEEFRDGTPTQKPASQSSARPTEATAPNYGQYAKQPLSAIPDKGLQDYLMGMERSINDPKKANFKSKNIAMRNAIQTELDKRASNQDLTDAPAYSQGSSTENHAPTMTAENVCQQIENTPDARIESPRNIPSDKGAAVLDKMKRNASSPSSDHQQPESSMPDDVPSLPSPASVMTLANAQQQLRLCEMVTEAASIMNQWTSEEHTQEDNIAMRRTFEETKMRLAKKMKGRS